MTRRRLLAIGLTLGSVVAIGLYGAVVLRVYERLSQVPVDCRPELAANRPDAFAADPDQDFDTGPYLMPSPETVTMPSRAAGIDVTGWWIPADRAGAPAIVVVHGVGACRRDPTVLIPAGMLHRRGFSILLIDLRDHGDSTVEDGRQAGGTEEYLEVLGAWDWLREQGVPAARIGLYGASMGAATVLIAGAEEPLVAAVFADSSYADVPSIVADELEREGYPTALAPGAMLAAKIVAGDDLTTRTPLRATAAYQGRPVAVVHGVADDRISRSYGSALVAGLASAGSGVEAWFVPGAGHTKSIYTAAADYEGRLARFFAAALDSRR